MVNVSVILPVHNSERYITEALESILMQSYRDFEVIVVDDGSTDRTGEIVRGYERSKASLIRCLYQRNAGPGAARNTGIRNARGPVIAFLDADDAWLKDKLKRQMEMLRSDPDMGLVYCDNYFVDAGGQIRKGYERDIALYSGSIAPQLFCHYFIMPSGVLLRRRCIDRVGYFREDIRVGEDYDLFLRVAYEFKVGLVREKLYRRRCLPDSLSNRDWTVNAKNDIATLVSFVRYRPLFYAGNKATVRERLGGYHFDLGYYALRRGWNIMAIRHLMVSLRYRRHPKTLKCLLLCLLPYRYVKGVQTAVVRMRTASREFET